MLLKDRPDDETRLRLPLSHRIVAIAFQIEN